MTDYPSKENITEPTRQQPHILRTMFGFAVGVLFTVAFAYILKPDISAIWSGCLMNKIAICVFFLSLLLWIIPWIAFDALESNILDTAVARWIRNNEHLYGYLLATIIPLFFSFFVANIAHPELLVAFMTLVVLGASVGDEAVIRGLRRESLAKDHSIKFDILKYYLEKPHMSIHCLQLAIISIAAALLYKYPDDESRWILYLTLSISIFINEGVLWKWRRQRIQGKL